MKIVHVEDFIHPDAGYQVNLLARLQVKDGHDVSIVTGEMDQIPGYLADFFGRDNIPARDERFFRETGAKIYRVPLISFYSGRAIFYPRLFKAVEGLNPDVVFVHGEDTLTGMRFLLRYSNLKYPIVFDCHSLEMGSINKLKHVFRFVYRRVFTPIILKKNIPLIRIADVDFVERNFGIPLSHTVLLSLGTDTDHFRPNAESRRKFCEENNISPEAFIALYAGKLDVTKGGKVLGETIRRKLVSSKGREIVFVVIGNTDGEYGRQVEETFKLSENRIIRLPTQRYFDLARYYQSVDLAMYPKQCSMSFFEAQSCGLPVLFEINEINTQRATHGNAITFEPDNVDDYRAKLLELADMPADKYAHMRENARQYILDNYDFVPVARRYTEVLAKAVEQFKVSNSGRPALAMMGTARKGI